MLIRIDKLPHENIQLFFLLSPFPLYLGLSIDNLKVYYMVVKGDQITAACCQVISVVSDSVLPHRQQPTRLPCPWVSPGKNTGVGCHFLFQCRKVESESEVTQSCPTLCDPTDCSLPGFSVHGIFPGKSTGVGCHCLLCFVPNKSKLSKLTSINHTILEPISHL